MRRIAFIAALLLSTGAGLLVANAGAERAISIHVYGADIERLGSSINKTFDHLPVRELDGATRQAWRGR